MNASDRDLLLKNINGSLKSKKLYPPGHPAIAAPINKSYQMLLDALKLNNNLMVSVVNEAIVFEDDLMPDSEKLYPDIISYLKDKNVDSIIFEKGITVKELSALVDILTAPGQLQGKDLQRELHAQNVVHITLKSIPTGKKSILEIYTGAVDAVKNVMSEVRMGKIPRSEPIKVIVDDITDTVFADPNAMLGLTMIKNYDNYLFTHSVNVSIMSLTLGKTMGLDKDALHAIGVAALLHDVGKTGVAEDIIRKPGGLSSEEWEKVKQHPLLGSNIAKRMTGLDELISRLIYEHHIKFDHSGYPQTAATLHPHSQIITISDAYDALTTLRVYQQPHNPVEAIKVMSNFSGRHFSPEILKAFISMIGVYPVGTMVRLTSNEIGVVTRINTDAPDHPVVKLLYDSDGRAYDPTIGVDLSVKKEHTIVTTVNPATTATDLGSFFEREAAAG